MKYRNRWADETIIAWADLFTSRRITLMEMEALLGVSHSTLWWCFTHRLPHIDYEKYELVTDCLVVNTHFKRQKETRA